MDVTFRLARRNDLRGAAISSAPSFPTLQFGNEARGPTRLPRLSPIFYT
jgi:hypothetical protein